MRTRTPCPTSSRSMCRTFARSLARTSSPRAVARGTSSMRRSIRWRLQGWYALMLLAVVSSFASILYYRVSAARFQEVDAQLEAAAFYLDTHLRRLPPMPPPMPPPDGVRDGPEAEWDRP